ncbi:hypothetical protein COOONC_21756, partial [Cooperia oncophora]
MNRAIRVIKDYARPYVFGMIHVRTHSARVIVYFVSWQWQTPMNKLSLPEILEVVKKEALIYASAQVDGIIVENMHDIPYVKPPIGPEIVSSMTLACQAVSVALSQQRERMLLGVQILAAGNKEALAVAHCA